MHVLYIYVHISSTTRHVPEGHAMTYKKKYIYIYTHIYIYIYMCMYTNIYVYISSTTRHIPEGHAITSIKSKAHPLGDLSWRVIF